MAIRSVFFTTLSSMTRIVVPLFVVLLLSSCSLVGQKPQVSYRASASTVLADDGRVKQALRSHYQKWRGTPYREGGMTPAGIDCSAFIQLTYDQLFGLDPGRSTDEQLARGQTVPREALRPGDLVFFRTGIFKNHVGIYFDDGWFVHASASKGVTVSTLKLGYWDEAFATARRY